LVPKTAEEESGWPKRRADENRDEKNEAEKNRRGSADGKKCESNELGKIIKRGINVFCLFIN
jgi:hypothetical protein